MESFKIYLLAERILLGADADVVIIEGLPEDVRGETELLSKSLSTVEALHETTADVVLAMPLNLLGCLTVKNKADGVLMKVRY